MWRSRRKRPHLWDSGNWLLHRDNRFILISMLVKHGILQLQAEKFPEWKSTNQLVAVWRKSIKNEKFTHTRRGVFNADSFRTQQVKWLYPSNIFNVLAKDPVTEENILQETTSKSTETKLFPIHIEAEIIESLINLLEETANNSYTLKQLNNNHVKFKCLGPSLLTLTLTLWGTVPPITLNNTRIQQVETPKYLGLHLRTTSRFQTNVETSYTLKNRSNPH